MQETSYLSSNFKKFSGGGMLPDPPRSKCIHHLQSGAEGALMLKYKSPPFSLGFPVFQSPSTSFTKVRVGSPACRQSTLDLIKWLRKLVTQITWSELLIDVRKHKWVMSICSKHIMKKQNQN